MMLYTKYQGSRPYGFRQEDFFNGLCKQLNVTPGPQGHNLNKLGSGSLGDATY